MNYLLGFGIALLVLGIVLCLVAFTPFNKNGIKPKKHNVPKTENKKQFDNRSNSLW
jgi:hypothetical protein